MGKDKLKFNSKTIHGGQQPDKGYGAVMPPVYLTSTYAQARLEGIWAMNTVAHTTPPVRWKPLWRVSKMAPTDSVWIGHGRYRCGDQAALSGDEVISTNDLYGGSYRIFTKIFEDFGIGFHFVDMQDPANVAAKINAKTQVDMGRNPYQSDDECGEYRSHAQAGGRQRHFTRR